MLLSLLSLIASFHWFTSSLPQYASAAVLGEPIQFPFHHDLHTAEVNGVLSPTVTLKSRPTTVYRPRSLDNVRNPTAEDIEWIPEEIQGPDIEDIHTLAQLARMSGNAYALPGRKNWYDLDHAWNTSFPFGWEDSTDGFRGHVFLSSDNNTIVLSIKGTTVQGPTSRKDKFNDNLLFSCCCARVDPSWVFHTVCDCYSGGSRCDNSCLSKALIQDSLFYSVGVGLVDQLLLLYPSSNVWLTGHSLGGALASLLGSTFGLPAVAFESPGERLAAKRLHLPMPPKSNSTDLPDVPITHVYHNGDPIPQGQCTGFGSACTQAGYALETRCHLGQSIVFDTIGKLRWHSDVRRHVIRDVITRVLEVRGIEWEDGRTVPLARPETDCVDCAKWEFGDFK